MIMSDKKIKAGLFGFGAVGQGTYQVLKANSWIPVSIERICIKSPGKERMLPELYFTCNKYDILRDDSVSVIIEAISEAEEAFTIVKEALLAGKNVVTANKKMLSEHLPELLELQARTGSMLRYEAAVCGAIPVLDVLDHHFAHEPIEELCGIVNGSTNYILCRMQAENLSFEEALRKAQELGFAEADPGLDVSGQDARNKIVVAALHAFGEVLKPEEVEMQGIDQLLPHAQNQAHKEGKRIKLLARLTKTGEGLKASVTPEVIGPDNPLFYVEDENNMVLLKGAYGGVQQLSGKGAGAFPTGTAVVADIRAVLSGRKYAYTKYQERIKLKESLKASLPVC